MWIWIVSLIVLIACLVFAYWMMASSYDYIPSERKFLFGFKRAKAPGESLNEETIRALRSKIKSIEETGSYHEIQFSKFQQRLQELENSNEKVQQPAGAVVGIVQAKENWMEMYYEELEKKEKLENELDEVRQQLTENDNVENGLALLQSKYDTRINEMRSVQNELDTMQLKYEAVTLRQKELEQLLSAEIELKNKFAQFETANTFLKCENENMRAHLKEMNKREEELEKKLAHARELESRVAIYEEEKYKLVSEMENMVNQNKIFFSGK